MLSLACFCVVIVCAHGYTTIVQKGHGPHSSQRLLNTQGLFVIPPGQCSAKIAKEKLGWVNTWNGPAAPSVVLVAVEDDVSYPQINIHDNLAQAEVLRAAPCASQALVSVTYLRSPAQHGPVGTWDPIASPSGPVVYRRKRGVQGPSSSVVSNLTE